MCAFGVLWLSCEALAVPKAPGFHTTAREPKRVHFRAPTFQTPPKFNEKNPPEREEKNEFLQREREKKERNFGRSWGRAVLGKRGVGEGQSWVSLGWGLRGSPGVSSKHDFIH